MIAVDLSLPSLPSLVSLLSDSLGLDSLWDSLSDSLRDSLSEMLVESLKLELLLSQQRGLKAMYQLVSS